VECNGGRAAHHAAEAEQLLSEQGLFFDPGQVTPELSFTSPTDFCFTSAMRSPFEENNRVSGRLFRTGPDWEKRPSVILLHGWNAELQYRWQFPALARRLARAGVNTAYFELPYHGRRRPRRPGAIHDFISHDFLRMVEATRQALADTRSLLAWLRKQGSPAAGLWGVSLGAWLTGLLVCAPGATNDGQGAPSFAVLLTPIARMDHAVAELDFCASIRQSLQAAPSLRLDALNLASHVPLLAPDRILLVEAEHDVFAPAESIERLWRAWGQPGIWRLPHGHISVLFSPRIMSRVIEWIREKAMATRQS